MSVKNMITEDFLLRLSERLFRKHRRDIRITTRMEIRNDCAMQWHDLQQENAPLRIYLNGQLISAPKTLYDYLIDREIEKESGEFREIAVIGNLVGLQLGVPDGWFALRIEKMIEDGRLSIVEIAKNGSSISDAGARRILRRSPKSHRSFFR